MERAESVLAALPYSKSPCATLVRPLIDIAPVVAFKDSGAVALTAKVPDALGSVSVGDPAADCAVTVAVPDVSPAKPRVPAVVPGTPKIGVAVAVIVSAVTDARTVPAEDEAGYVEVDHDGAALDPDLMIWPAVAVPERTASALAPEYTMPPLDAVRFAAVPPRASDSCPLQPSVKDVACSKAVVGVPPSVNVTLVSSTRVKA